MNKKQWLTMAALVAVLLGGTASAAEQPAAEGGSALSAPTTRIRVCICACAARGALLARDGTVLQELTFDRKDQTVAGPLEAGDYTVRAGALQAHFTLRANGSVCRVSGDGWTDGERLHLSADTVGSLTILHDGAYRWQLEGETVCTPELTEGCCRYRALPFGSYLLRGSGRTIPLLLTPRSAEQLLDLRISADPPLDPP